MKLNYAKLEKLFIEEAITRLIDCLLFTICVLLMWYCANNKYSDWLVFWGFLSMSFIIPPAVRLSNVIKSLVDLEEKELNG
jgi:uncharacterized membrane protein YbhN (UPF0104 family)